LIRSLTAMVLSLAAYGEIAAQDAAAFRQERRLRLSEPVEAIIADLESYVPEYMSQQDIPGVAIALVHDGEIVWVEGFGSANSITRKPVTPRTLFEVASNSKAMTGYVALRLVDRGELSLDTPLNDYLSEPWLPDSEHRKTITLRHVLSHTSGLGANITLSRSSLFAPGEGYYYSGIGFMYLQEVIEQIAGQSLEAVARQMMFEPLGMSSSYFVNAPAIVPQTANGHLRAGIPALLFIVPYGVSVAVFGMLALLIMRIRTGHWRLSVRMVVAACVVAYVPSLLPVLILLGRVDLWEFVWLIALCGLVLGGAFAVALFIGRVVILRLLPKRRTTRRALTIFWSLLIVVGLAMLAGEFTNVPVPKWPPTSANAAGSVRATVGDMANFLIELSNPQHLSAQTAAELQTPQVALSSNLSWGLGFGIQHSQHGNALWQWGQHLDFQSIMIIYPTHGFGTAVCTNSDFLNPDVALEIAHRALGGEIEPIRRAVHLAFNYDYDGGN
jgi:CubicO group peptidase (beta-lactamase class C family)